MRELARWALTAPLWVTGLCSHSHFTDGDTERRGFMSTAEATLGSRRAAFQGRLCASRALSPGRLELSILHWPLLNRTKALVTSFVYTFSLVFLYLPFLSLLKDGLYFIVNASFHYVPFTYIPPLNIRAFLPGILSPCLHGLCLPLCLGLGAISSKKPFLCPRSAVPGPPGSPSAVVFPALWRLLVLASLYSPPTPRLNGSETSVKE